MRYFVTIAASDDKAAEDKEKIDQHITVFDETVVANDPLSAAMDKNDYAGGNTAKAIQALKAMRGQIVHA